MQILDFYYADTALRSIGSFETAPALSSETYTISAAGVSGIAPGTTSDELLLQIFSTAGALIVISSTGAQIPGSLLKTGDFVRSVYGEGTSYSDLPVLIFGDIDGNGIITQGDLDTLRAHLMNTNRLTGVYLSAADISHDSTVNSHDGLLLLKHIQGNLSIEQ